MLRCWLIAVAALVCPFSGEAAHACRVSVPLAPGDIKYADMVIVGRIENYKVIRDPVFRQKMLDSPALSPEMRRFYEDKNANLLSDYARFDIVVDQVLVGKAPFRLSVTWDNSTFAEPKAMDAGPYLIALRKADSSMPPLRGPSATIIPSPEAGLLTVLQAPCSSPFILASTGDEARAVREVLSARPR
ncbi:MAG: hypothetical protein WC729_28735 [Sphingomonas sp.]|jgi:hypothetical protein|uniref:hypothetical protein n=1 Tax=Sphingomonas sp. TaxID=28214 RepID=UPI003568391A